MPPGDVYGAYVPYVPPAQPIGCGTPAAAPAAASNASQPNASVVQKPQPPPASLVNPESPTPFKLAPPTSTDLALKADAPPAPALPAAPPADSSAEEGAFVQPVPLHRAPVIYEDLKPFRSYAIGFKGSTLGAGFEIATPLAGRINLRYGFNLVEFTDPFSVDGVNYHAGIHLKSSQTTVDWFFGSFHISPGVLYLKNNMSAPASVGPGQTFVLGTQTFLNSVDDPVTGSSSVIYPRTFSPMLLIGYGNMLPRSGPPFASRRSRLCVHRRSCNQSQPQWDCLRHQRLRHLFTKHRRAGFSEAGDSDPQRRSEALRRLSHRLRGIGLSLLILATR